MTNEHVESIREHADNCDRLIQGMPFNGSARHCLDQIRQNAGAVEADHDTVVRYARKVTKMLRRELSTDAWHEYDAIDVDALIEQYGVTDIMED